MGWAGALVLLVLGAACSSGPPDAGAPDGEALDGSSVIPWLAEGEPPVAMPQLTCPRGWGEVAASAPGDPPTCDPYAPGGPLDCPDGQAHFPGESDCAPVGPPCPASDFSEVLPADRNVVYVQPGASGDGSSAARPHGSLTEFSLTALPVDTVIALSRGTHTGPIRLVRGIALWGVCAADTVVTASAPSTLEAVVTVRDASAEARDLTLADSALEAVRVEGGTGEVLLDGVVTRGVSGTALYATAEGRLIASAVAVLDTRGRSADGRFGRGLNLDSGGSAELTRIVFEANRDICIFGGGAGTTLTMTDAMLRDTSGQADGTGGRAISVQDGAAAELTRLLLVGNRDAGLAVLGAGASARVADLVVRDTDGVERDGTRGYSAIFRDRVDVEVTRAVFEGSREFGIVSDAPRTAVTLTDIVVRDIEGRQSDEVHGWGLSASAGASVEVSRGLIARARQVAVFAYEPESTVALSDVTIRDTREQASDGTFGLGIASQHGGTVTVTRALLEGNRDLGAFGGAGTVTLSDVAIRATRRRECVETTCPASFGHGAGAYDGSIVSMDRFLVESADVCGVQLATRGQMDLTNGVVRNTLIGVCLQVDGYDTDRLTRNVQFVDNGTNLQATTLPVPEVIAPIPDGGP